MLATLWLDAGRPWSDLLSLAGQAERAGWDSVRFGDDPDDCAGAVAGPVPGSGRARLECWAVLGGLAEAVPRVRLEAVVCHGRGRHPAVVAKLASTVDQLSGGRLLLGWAPAADVEGEDRLAESIEVVASLARYDRSTFDGRFYRLQDAPLDPKAVQQTLAVLLIGGSPALAARYADHWSIAGRPEQIRSQLAALEEACRTVGRDRNGVTASAVGDPSGSVVEYARAGVDEWVVPSAALGPDRAAWPESLARIRSDTEAIDRD